jgi:hypothetical protein
MPPHQHRLVVGVLAFVGSLLALLLVPHPAWPAGAARRAAAPAPPGASASLARHRPAGATRLARLPAPPASESLAERRRPANASRPARISSPPAAFAERPAASRSWRWPLRGDVVGRFHFSRRAPFMRGQRRGVDIAAAPGTAVRAACGGRVVFAGAVPDRGLAVTVRCGSVRATFLGLGRLAVRAGAHLARGAPLGALGPAGRLRLGARRAGDRHGYVDPLLLIGEDPPPFPPVASRAPRAVPRPERPAPRAVPLAGPTATPAPAAGRARLPWPAYPALALIAAALPIGGLLRRRRRRAAATQPAHEAP